MVRGLALGALVLLVPLASAETHPTIRQIRVEHAGVFSEDERLDQIPFLPDLTFIFDAANFLHFDTRHSVIKREMLVEEGGPADPELLAESERNLRDLPFLRQARVRTELVAPGEVDVIAHVQDTWTTEPRLSFSLGGGDSQSELGIVEKNLFGRGKTIRLLREEELDRTSNSATYEDPRVWGTRWAFRGGYEDTSDGDVRELLVERPFFAIETPWALRLRFDERRELNTIYENGGLELSEFVRDQSVAEVEGGLRLGISTRERIHRAGLFFLRIDDDFENRLRDGLRPEIVPEDRTESMPGFFYRREVVNFVRERHFNLFDRIEDLNIGNVFEARLGYSLRSLGGTDDEPVLRVFDRIGFDFGPGHKAFLLAFLTGRYARGHVRNAIAELEAISFHRGELLSVEQTLVTRLKLDFGWNLDRDVQIFLGNDNGLRGFDTREIVGSRRFIFNLEDRLFVVNDLFHLVSLGAVVFFDSGMGVDRGEAVALDRFASSVGIGLRIGAPRAAGEKIWRLDLAIPLSNANGDRFGPSISIGSGQAFAPFSGPFDLQTTSGE